MRLCPPPPPISFPRTYRKDVTQDLVKYMNSYVLDPKWADWQVTAVAV